ncbi:hypothetical protein GCM10011506_15220 [Marivirga lumbricoides]|uniref:Cyclic nucleotide-binding domain-containing protein n=1 Tax=Marivirga lumbricoides TaxID=1046115 RepID=A0ABQ1LYI7_9BACT|nr:hypothetical protein GCM10011506_15220 [Marivirga lumbricoides]
MGIPISFYSWLTLKITNQKVAVIASGNKSLKKYFSIETYVLILSIALFGIIYDYIPNKAQYLLWIPLFILIGIGLLNFIFNSFQIEWVFKSISEEETESFTAYNNTPPVFYELNPYQFEKNIKENLISCNTEERVRILDTIKQIVGIDILPLLKEFKEDYETDDLSENMLNLTIEYLEKVKFKVEAVKNQYELVEQSNDIILIKGLLRNQINNKDKNLVIKLLNDNRNSIKKSASIVAGYSDDINFISVLIEHLSDPSLSIWAQFALKNIGFKAVKYLEIEFSKRKANLFFVEACFEVLSEVKEAQEVLLKAINDPNKNIQLIAVKKLIHQLQKPTIDQKKYFNTSLDELIINQLINNYILTEIEKKNETFYQLKKALKSENKESLYLIKSLLRLFYNKKIIDTIFSYYPTSDVYGHALSNHLIDLIFEDNYSLLFKIKALFSPEDPRLIELLEEEFPNIEFRKQHMDEESLIWNLLKMDYDRFSNWTRACAINTLQYLYSEDIPFELAAEFLNKDKLLKETAAICIYKNIPEFYTIFLNRLDKSEATKLDFAVRSNVDFVNSRSLREDNLLLYDKVQFLISVPYLKKLSINEINTFETFFRTKVLGTGEHTVSINDENLSGFWLVESGHVQFSDNGTDFSSFVKRDIIEVLPIKNESGKVYFSLNEPARFLIIEKIVLLNILKDSHNIILNRIGEKSDFYSKLPSENNFKEEVA